MHEQRYLLLSCELSAIGFGFFHRYNDDEFTAERGPSFSIAKIEEIVEYD